MLKPGFFSEGQEMVIDKAGLSKLDGQLTLLRFVGVDPKAVADVGQVAATTADRPGQEPFGEAFRKGLFDPARAHTLDAALGGQAHDFEFSEFLTYDDHLATFWGFAVIPNSCSDYKTADSRTQIRQARLKA
jgi:hypothetical protein